MWPSPGLKGKNHGIISHLCPYSLVGLQGLLAVQLNLPLYLKPSKNNSSFENDPLGPSPSKESSVSALSPVYSWKRLQTEAGRTRPVLRPSSVLAMAGEVQGEGLGLPAPVLAGRRQLISQCPAHRPGQVRALRGSGSGLHTHR